MRPARRRVGRDNDRVARSGHGRLASRQLHGELGAAVLASSIATAQNRRFYDDDPIGREPETQDASGVAEWEIDLIVDLAINMLGRPGDKATNVRARNINTIDELPDSNWFTNRIASRPVTVDEAVKGGATLLTGGTRDGATYAPTVLADLPGDATLSCEEAFGPVLSVQRADSEEAAFAAVNDSKYGLQAGVLTHDLQAAFRAHRALEVGGVIIGDVPSYRADQMPYGGVKESGVGREGVAYAMDDYTYERVMVLTGLDL